MRNVLSEIESKRSTKAKMFEKTQYGPGIKYIFKKISVTKYEYVKPCVKPSVKCSLLEYYYSTYENMYAGY